MKKILIISLFCIFILFLRTATLQINRGESYLSLAEGNRLRIRTIAAERGVIADRNGRVLASNLPTFSLSVVPNDLPKSPQEKERVLRTLSALAEISFEELKIILSDFAGSNLAIPIKENLSYQNALFAEIKIASLPGVQVNQDTRRHYSAETDGMLSLSHILGYQGKISKQEYEKMRDQGYLRTDRVGKTGVESFYEQRLRGVYGEEKIEVDALGNKKRIVAKKEAEPGKNVLLTIDFDAQKKLEELMRKALRANSAVRATAIVMDPNNGEIIAFVNLPSFSSNEFSAGISGEQYKKLLEDPNAPLFVRGISGEYPSGSTIKPFIAAAALDEGIINKNTIIHSTGGIQIGEWFFPDWKAGGHGDVNVISAIAQSVNTFFYYIGGGFQGFRGLGPGKIIEHARRFGLGQKTGIDLNGEAEGLLPTEEWKMKVKKEDWYIGDTYHMSIGQGDVLVTPIQIAAATAAIANGGTVWRPHVLYGYFDADNQGNKFNPAAASSEAAGKETLAIVRRAMRETVLNGSARSLASLFISSAGKTGTAQWRDGARPHAWFSGFAPYENPRIVVTILIEEAGEGSVVAVPVVKDFLQWYFAR